METKILFTGGNPRGYKVPFDQRTKSGNALRRLVNELQLQNVKYFDLWKNPKEEDELYQDSDVLRNLLSYQKDGWIIIALGNKVQGAMKCYAEWSKSTWDYGMILSYVPLPHPAARSKRDFQALREGLEKLVHEN